MNNYLLYGIPFVILLIGWIVRAQQSQKDQTSIAKNVAIGLLHLFELFLLAFPILVFAPLMNPQDLGDGAGDVLALFLIIYLIIASIIGLISFFILWTWRKNSQWHLVDKLFVAFYTLPVLSIVLLSLSPVINSWISCYIHHFCY